MKIVAFLPIKLNSQRVSHKNARQLNGKPLCWHLTNSLLAVDEIDDVYVFCSDPSVKNLVPEKAKLLLRDPYLDGSEIKSFELIGTFVSKVDADLYVFANTTSPFLKPESIRNSIEKIKTGLYDSALTVQRFQTFARYKGEAVNYDVNDIPRTQDMEPVYIETSGFYMFKKEIFQEHHRRIGFTPYYQEVDFIEAIDIDTEEDFKYAEMISKFIKGE